MGALSFFGLLFLGCGPLIIVYLAIIARKSFLVLLGLARWADGQIVLFSLLLSGPPPCLLFPLCVLLPSHVLLSYCAAPSTGWSPSF